MRPSRLPPWGTYKSIQQKAADSGDKEEYTAAIPLVSSADGQLRRANAFRLGTRLFQDSSRPNRLLDGGLLVIYSPPYAFALRTPLSILEE